MATEQRTARKRNSAPYPRQMTAAKGKERHSTEQHSKVHQGSAPVDETDGSASWSVLTPQCQNGEQQDELDEYMQKRLRNNAAVSRTRQKKRMEQVNTSQRVKELREENTQLERTLDTMRRELALLKEMVVVCAAKGDDQTISAFFSRE